MAVNNDIMLQEKLDDISEDGLDSTLCYHFCKLCIIHTDV
jgi:hypothetical protein